MPTRRKEIVWTNISIVGYMRHSASMGCIYASHRPLCGEFTGTAEFVAQRASYAENVSIWWRHHVSQILIAIHGRKPGPGGDSSSNALVENRQFFISIYLLKNLSRKTLISKRTRFDQWLHFCHLGSPNSMCFSEARNTWNTLHSLCVLDQMGKCGCTKIKNY